MTRQRDSEAGVAQSAEIVVGVCTFRRNDQLSVLLETLAAVSRQQSGRRRIMILVVDDDPAGGARAVVDRLAASSDGRMLYRHAGSGNLSIARNTVIEEGIERGEWLALIDDDCLPDPDWLEHLIDVQVRTRSDMVTGHVVYRARPGAARWLMNEPFCDFTAYEDGGEPAYGNTANVLLSSAFLKSSGVRFRPTLGLTGGEDMTFYADARSHGASLRYSARSIVYEDLTRSRERLAYHLHRQFWLGNNMVVINRHTRNESMLRLLLRGAKRIVTSLVLPVLRYRRGQPAQVRWAVAYALQGLGLVLGVLGVTIRHRP